MSSAWPRVGAAVMILIVVAVVVAVAVIFGVYSKRGRPPIRIQQELKDSYDYVIVGGGSAGCVLANRLSEDPDVTVLVLEAGIAEYPPSDVPSNAFALVGSKVDWKYVTEPQKHCCGGLNNRVSNWPSGKVLGGSSTINVMMYLRGSPHDYDSWRDQGCEGWGYDDILPYFNKAETMMEADLARSKYHGTSGPTKISYPEINAVGQAFLDAGKERGNATVDVNGKENLGFGIQQANIDNGVRCGALEAYLRPVTHRKNLHVATGADVIQIIFKDKKAVGVKFFRDDRLQQVNSNREVIMSAGSIRSPHLLMLSGVGPKEQLQKHNIPVVADLPVGQGLENHMFTSAAFFTANTTTRTEKDTASLWTQLQYKLYHKGYMAGTGAQASALVRTPSQLKDDKLPRILLILLATPWASGPGGYAGSKYYYNWKDDVFDALHGGFFDKYGFSIVPVLLHPNSKGSITLKSSDPKQYPKITTNALQDPRDIKTLVEGVKIAQSLEDTDAFKSIGAKMSRRMHPLCTDHEWGTDEYWRCFVEQDTLPMIHPSTTCKMGPTDQPDAVVDLQLKVKGLEGIRVVDASVLPHTTSGNLYAPVLMIAEKAADMIKEDYKA